MADPHKSFYWYDLETSGTSPATDRIVQFAGQRTDLEMHPVGAPYSTYIRLPPDIVPTPESCLVTGITPQQAIASGIDEWQAMTEIDRIFSTPGTSVAGYNNLRFDDEFIRYALYRNLFDPYAREWRDGNSRWDLIDLVRATAALRPEGIVWPNPDDVPTFRLEALAEANGLVHASPHDALSDVRATIALARLIHARQPRLFQYALTLRSKHVARRLLVPFGQKVCVHASGRLPNARYCTAPVLSVAQHPTMDNGIIVADLGRDVSPLVERSADELRETLFAEGAEERPPLKQVRLNRCPFLAPIEVVRPQDAERLGVDAGLIEERRTALLAAPGLADKIARVYLREDRPAADPDTAPDDVEERLYAGFTPDADRHACDTLQRELRAHAAWPTLQFGDARLTELHARLKARLRPESLTPAERADWRRFVARRLTTEHPRRMTLEAYRRDVAARLGDAGDGPQREVLLALDAYGAELEGRTTT